MPIGQWGVDPMSTSACVYIIDDDKAVRDSLAWLLESAGLSVRAYESARAFLDELDRMAEEPRGCLLVDIRLPGMSGLDLQDALRERGVCTPVIVITGHGDVPVAVRAMKAGAFDFVEKPFADQVLLDRIREALDHDQHRCQERDDRQALVERFERLSVRERQVMERVVQGKLNKQIAAELGLSPKTIEVHRSKVMDKMQAASLAELVRIAIAIEGPASDLRPPAAQDPAAREH